MFDEEKNKLEEQIASLFKRLKEIEIEQQEIEDRQGLIDEIKDLEHSIKFCKKMLKIMVPGIIVISFGMITTSTISLLNTIILSFIASLLCVLAFCGESIKEAIVARNILRKKSKQFEEAKENEEKDKELKISLEKDYTSIKEDLLPLEYKLSWFKKNEAMQKLGYELELMISNFKQKEEKLNDYETKEFYDKLWETYLEEQDYKKVHLYNNEIESSQTLSKKLH